MTCNLCHADKGHTQQCATQIMVPWQQAGSLHGQLATALIEVWSTPVKDMELFLEARKEVMKAFEEQDYVSALETLRTYLDA